jgi:hypothetical protein
MKQVVIENPVIKESNWGLAIVHLFQMVFPWQDLYGLNFQELNV